MNLHRAETKPEWESIDPAKRNIAQKVAAATRGIMTPGNIISVAGAVFVTAGLVDIAKGKTRSGALKMAIGRMADLADGFVADKTGTKSPIGEATDVVIDKLELATVTPVLIAKGIVPPIFGAAVGAQTMANGYYTKVAKDAGNEIHTGEAGKFSTLLQWIALGVYGVSAVMRESSPQSSGAAYVERGADMVALVSAGLGFLSVVGYRHDALAEQPMLAAEQELPLSE